MKKNTLYLIGGTVLAYFILKKLGLISEIGDNQRYVIAKGGGLLKDTPYGLAILYNFKGGERLPVIADLGQSSLVEFKTPTGNILRGQISDVDVVNPN